MKNNSQLPHNQYKPTTGQKVMMGASASLAVGGVGYLLFKKPGLLWRGLIAGGLSTILDLGVANIGRYLFDAPAEYAPFTFLPILSGGLGGALGATSVYALFLRFNRHPVKNFRYTAGLVLLASYYLPTRLLVTKSTRFTGANLPIVITQMVMHTVVAACSVYILTRPTDND